MSGSKNWPLGKVALKVNDLEIMTAFYEQVLGLGLLAQTESRAVLGISSTREELVELIRLERKGERRRTTGLYHLALLVPSRKDLGEILYHLLVTKYPLEGASDHGYSEALYLTDPEGNGIEVYCDKPVSAWDIREDGRIEGYTLPMDAEGVLQAAKVPFQLLPAGTKMGHIHLTVRDLKETQQFYEKILGLTLKSDFFGQAKFLARGNYHHHIGANTWAGTGLPDPGTDDLGLAGFTWLIPDEKELTALRERLGTAGIVYKEEDSGLSFLDNSGLRIAAVRET